MRIRGVLLAVVVGPVVFGPALVRAHGAPERPIGDAPLGLGSLKAIPIPEPANLADFVRDRDAAIALGKALFWDSQVGSNGQACASCHFHAGADNRRKNQLNPGLNGGDATFSIMATGGAGGPNYTLAAGDFPFHRLADPLDRNSAILYDTNDVSSSQGTFDGGFVSTAPWILPDICGAPDRSVFQVGGIAVRKVEPRNTPTMINAVFNYRNFWDGRANNTFNGVSPFGARDVNARILEAQADGSLRPVAVALRNASLASQAVGPPTSDNEMSCLGRNFADIGHKMFTRIPLEIQAVSATDSVLGPMRGMLGLGLTRSYRQLIEQAFQPRYWSSSQPVNLGGKLYTQQEANFSLFWGLAIELYESTLISDDAPIDRWFDGDPTALTDQELRGMAIFEGKGKCIECHGGPELTTAATRLEPDALEGGLVERMAMGDFGIALYDQGFYNTGVRPSVEDRGAGGSDPFGNPLSFSRQYKARIGDPSARDAVDGAFKVPSLRNVELTGPYFHNGGASTLEQVVAFYNRGGDRRGPDGNDTTGLGVNRSNLDADIDALGLTADEQADLVAFLERPLTDERVRWEAAPFDHPGLLVPDGNLGDEHRVLDFNRDGKAEDGFLLIPAVGASGRSVSAGPVMPFLQ